MEPVSDDQAQVRHKIAGGLEVAQDIVERTVFVYLSDAAVPDQDFLEELTRARVLLARARETLLRSSPGPLRLVR
jgi:hypothetical protein